MSRQADNLQTVREKRSVQLTADFKALFLHLRLIFSVATYFSM